MRHSRRNFLLGAGAAALSVPFFDRVPSAHAQAYPTRLVCWFTATGADRKKLLAAWSRLRLDRRDAAAHATQRQDHDDRRHGRRVGGRRCQSRSQSDRPHPHQRAEQPVRRARAVLRRWDLARSVRGGAAQQRGAVGRHPERQSLPAPIDCRTTAETNRPHPEEDPAAAFDSTFASFILPLDQLAILRAKRGRVLDAVQGHLSSLRPKLATMDKDKLDKHLELIIDLENKLTASTGGITCSPNGAAADRPYRQRQHPADHTQSHRRGGPGAGM